MAVVLSLSLPSFFAKHDPIVRCACLRGFVIFFVHSIGSIHPTHAHKKKRSLTKEKRTTMQRSLISSPYPFPLPHSPFLSVPHCIKAHRMRLFSPPSFLPSPSRFLFPLPLAACMCVLFVPLIIQLFLGYAPCTTNKQF